MPPARAPGELILIGYLPKQFVAVKGTADAPAYPGVAEICSVSERRNPLPARSSNSTTPTGG